MVVLSASEPPRVVEARRAAEPELARLHRVAGVPRGGVIFLRAFKREREVEVWVAPDSKTPMTRLEVIPVLAASGVLGPKSRQGDLQVPEGHYHIDRFNPQSRFLLSLGLNYPNASDRRRIANQDRERGEMTADLGGDIFIHGKQASIGCLALGDPAIQRLYVLAWDAHLAGQRKIPVAIYPFRFGKGWRSVRAELPQWMPLWERMATASARFDRERLLPRHP